MGDSSLPEQYGSEHGSLTTVKDFVGRSGLERQFQAIFAAIPDAIALLDAQGRYREIYAGDLGRLHGPAPAQVGRSITDLLPDPIAEQIEALITKTIASRTMGKLAYPLQQGNKQRWVSALVVPFGLDHDPCVLLAARDITDEKRVEEALQAAEARLIESQCIARIGSWERNLVTGCLWWSDQMYELFDVERASFHLTIDNVLELIIAEDRERVRSELEAAIATGDSITTEYRVRRKNGDVVLLSGQGRLTKDPAGKAWRFSGTVQDVTMQRRTQARVQRAERLASLGVLAAGIAHEINNPLFAAWVAACAATTYKNRPGQGEFLDECLRVIVESIGRCQAVVKNVLLLAGKQSPEKRICELNAIVRQAFETTCQYRERDLNMKLEPTPYSLQVLANGVELEQMLVNLIRNAIQAESRNILIETELVGKEAVVRVRDDGRGIPKDAMDLIFDPFFTQGKSVENIGLGLSIAHAIAIDHCGQIDVESTVGHGTILRVRIPLAAEQSVHEG